MGKELFKLKAMAKNKCVYKLAREEKLKRLKVRRHFLTPKEQVSEKNLLIVLVEKPTQLKSIVTNFCFGAMPNSSLANRYLGTDFHLK